MVSWAFDFEPWSVALRVNQHARKTGIERVEVRIGARDDLDLSPQGTEAFGREEEEQFTQPVKEEFREPFGSKDKRSPFDGPEVPETPCGSKRQFAKRAGSDCEKTGKVRRFITDKQVSSMTQQTITRFQGH